MSSTDEKIYSSIIFFYLEKNVPCVAQFCSPVNCDIANGCRASMSTVRMTPFHSQVFVTFLSFLLFQHKDVG